MTDLGFHDVENFFMTKNSSFHDAEKSVLIHDGRNKNLMTRKKHFHDGKKWTSCRRIVIHDG